MLTEEQIKNLKPGDPIVINTTFSRVDADGDIRFNTPSNNGSNYEPFVDPDCVSIPPEKPKYSPTRRFRKGDIVQTVERWGRKVPDAVGIYGYEVPGGPEDKKWEVVEAETSGMVEVLCKIGGEFYRHKLPFFHLELVTPVEERTPYSVHEDSSNNRWSVIKYKYVHGIHAIFPYKNIGNSALMSREEAKARADEYCDRLNAEWRKEHEND